MDLHSAFSYTHARRPVVRPNNGFFKQLLNYEAKLFGKHSFKMTMVTANGVTIEVPEFFQTEHRGFIILESLKEKSKLDARNRGEEPNLDPLAGVSGQTTRQPSPPEAQTPAEQERSDQKKENLLKRFVVTRNPTSDEGMEAAAQTSEPNAEEKARNAPADRRSRREDKRER